MAESLENLSFKDSEMESRSVKEQGSSGIECAMTAELLQNTLSIEQQVINDEAPNLSPLAGLCQGSVGFDGIFNRRKAFNGRGAFCLSEGQKP